MVVKTPSLISLLSDARHGSFIPSSRAAVAAESIHGNIWSGFLKNCQK